MTQIIAEAANNHGGNVEKAKRMIKAAAEAGADFIKFQSWQIKNMDPSNPDYKLMKSTELSDEDHKVLMEECKKTGIRFLTTCFDIKRIDFLVSLGLDTIKVASTDVGSEKILKFLREKFDHIILSTGMSTKEEVEKAVEILKKGKFTLLHCVSLYPTPLEKANLGRINWLRNFTENVGYSDHTEGNVAAKIAISLGAKIVEKHFDLERKPGNKYALMNALPEDIKEIVEFTGKYEGAEYEIVMGEGSPEMAEGEQESRERFVGRWGDNR